MAIEKAVVLDLNLTGAKRESLNKLKDAISEMDGFVFNFPETFKNVSLKHKIPT